MQEPILEEGQRAITPELLREPRFDVAVSIPEVPGALGGIGRIERLALHDCSHALEALTDIQIEGLASI